MNRKVPMASAIFLALPGSRTPTSSRGALVSILLEQRWTARRLRGRSAFPSQLRYWQGSSASGKLLRCVFSLGRVAMRGLLCTDSVFLSCVSDAKSIFFPVPMFLVIWKLLLVWKIFVNKNAYQRYVSQLKIFGLVWQPKIMRFCGCTKTVISVAFSLRSK